MEICRRMVEGESLRTICKAPGMPTFVTVFNWRRAHPEFLEQYEQYARAREDQADALAEEMLDLVRKAVHAKTHEEVQGYRLLVDTLKWRASKMKPKSYGDKLTLEAEVSVRQMTDEQLNARLAYLLSEMRKPELVVGPGEPIVKDRLLNVGRPQNTS